MNRGQLPKAYLRIDPNIDQARPELRSTIVGLMCAANRQPRRGWFRSKEHAEAILGKTNARRFIDRGDLIENEDGWYVEGWDHWQEGDLSVGERMARLREKRRAKHGTDNRTDGAYRTANWRLRTAVFERDQFTCRYCGNQDYDRSWLVADHVIPQPEGETSMENLVTACRSCNKKKGPMTPEQAGMPILPVTGHA